MRERSIIDYDILKERIREYAYKAGKMTTRPMLLLFFVLKSSDTPWKDKILILTTLSYLIVPIDIIDAKRIPIIGWSDEIASFSVAYQKVSKYITPEMEAKVDAILEKWFSDNYNYTKLTT